MLWGIAWEMMVLSVANKTCVQIEVGGTAELPFTLLMWCECPSMLYMNASMYQLCLNWSTPRITQEAHLLVLQSKRAIHSHPLNHRQIYLVCSSFSTSAFGTRWSWYCINIDKIIWFVILSAITQLRFNTYMPNNVYMEQVVLIDRFAVVPE